MNIRFPNITAATEAEQIIQIKSYLHQLVQQLNWALSTLEAGIGSGSTSNGGNTLEGISAETFYELKALLVKSTDTLNAYYDKINNRLEGQYVNSISFNVYKLDVAQRFEELATKYVSQEAYDAFRQELDQILEDLGNQYVSREDYDAHLLENGTVLAVMQQSIVELQQAIETMQETGGE